MALTDKLRAIGDGFRLSRETSQKYTLEEMAVLAAEKASSVPDGTDVTFGNVDGNPVEREEAYAIKSADLNALGRISQFVAGQNYPMTVAEMIYVLDKAKFFPCGNAVNVTTFTCFESSAVCALQEG